MDPAAEAAAEEPAAEADPVDAEVGAEAPLSPPPKKRSRVAYRAAAPADKPKRAPNAFMIYSKEKRQAYDLKAMKVTEVAKDIGAQWRALPEEEKTRYKQMALELKAAA